MNILITGVAGFIGSFLSRRLILDGHNVIGVDNFDPFYDKKVKLFNLDLINKAANQEIKNSRVGELEKIYELLGYKTEQKVGNFEFYEIDIRDRVNIDGIFKDNRIDAVVHLAAMAGVPHSLKFPYEYTDVNVLGTVSILEAARNNGVKKFIFASSSSVYGESDSEKFIETQDTSKSISPYAATKKMGEIINYTYYLRYGINIANIRIFTVYGPLQRPYGMAMQKFIKQAYFDNDVTVYGDGSMMRDFTYIDDLIGGIISVLNSEYDFITVNIGNDSPVSVKFLAETIVSKVGRGRVVYVSKPSTEVTRTAADISLAKRLFGFSPNTSIDEGISNQINVFNSMPDWFKELKD